VVVSSIISVKTDIATGRSTTRFTCCSGGGFWSVLPVNYRPYFTCPGCLNRPKECLLTEYVLESFFGVSIFGRRGGEKQNGRTFYVEAFGPYTEEIHTLTVPTDTWTQTYTHLKLTCKSNSNGEVTIDGKCDDCRVRTVISGRQYEVSCNLYNTLSAQGKEAFNREVTANCEESIDRQSCIDSIAAQIAQSGASLSPTPQPTAVRTNVVSSGGFVAQSTPKVGATLIAG